MPRGEEHGDLKAARVLVRTFSGLLERDLQLRHNAKPYVDGHVLAVPTGNADVYALTELLLAHLVFHSDLEVQRMAVRTLTARVKVKASTVRGIFAALETARVLSLWERLYPGSYAILREKLRRDAETLVSTTDPVSSLMCVYTEQPSLKFPEKLHIAFQEALVSVERKDVPASLYATERLLGFLKKEGALDPAIIPPSGSNSGAEGSPKRLDSTKPTSPTKATSAARGGALEAVKTNHTYTSEVRRLTVGTARSRPKLSVQARALRGQLGVAAPRLVETGIDLDVGAFIERRTSRTETPCFRDTVCSLSRSVLVLIDMSLSMSVGNRQRWALETAETIHDVLSSPTSSVGVWGFRSVRNGVTEILEIIDIMAARSMAPQGFTPLHVALREGVNHLRRRANTKVLILISDGGPRFYETNGAELDIRTLNKAVSTEVRRAHSLRVGITALVLGSRDTDGAFVADISAKEATELFGSYPKWLPVSDDTPIAFATLQAVLNTTT